MLHDDVHLLQVHADGEDSRPHGLYQRWVGGTAYAYNLVAVIQPGPVLRARFEAVMTQLAAAFPLTAKPTTLAAIPTAPLAPE
jgi:hypothetical protein